MAAANRFCAWFRKSAGSTESSVGPFGRYLTPIKPLVTFGVVWQLKSLQRKMQASGHLPQQGDKAELAARSSPDLQWMLAARSKIGLYAPGGELEGDQQQADHLAAAQMPSPKAQRGANSGGVDAGRIVGWTQNSDKSRITPKDEAQELTLDALSQASSVKGCLGQETDHVEEELIGVLCSMIQQR